MKYLNINLINIKININLTFIPDRITQKTNEINLKKILFYKFMNTILY